MTETQPNYFSGSFYPADPVTLQRFIEKNLTPPLTDHAPLALVVPHAGYVYSGKTALHAFSQAASYSYQRIILLGPAHRSYHQGLALSSADSTETPLGNLPNDKKIALELTDNLFKLNTSAFIQEHSLEVQLPFLKYLFPHTPILPIIVGELTPPEAAQAGAKLQPLVLDNSLLVISSDLSHYHPLTLAKQIDTRTINSLLRLSASQFWNDHLQKNIECCGIFPLLLALNILQEIPALQAELIHYQTSADASLDSKQVVGYAAIQFFKED